MVSFRKDRIKVKTEPKKIIYINCFADPWIRVAEALKEKCGYEPIYWIGYNEDNSEHLVPQKFPSIIYQRYFNAWKGIFPSQIEDRASESYINIDFLRQYASQELQAIKMMDRLDFDLYSFNFTERQRHFRNFVRYWTACIDYLKPDLVITPAIPHRVYDYTLYLLCKFMNIKFIILNHTSFNGRYLIIDDIFSIENTFKDDYSQLQQSTEQSEIPADILDKFQKLRKDYGSAAPLYMATSPILDKASTGIINLTRKFFKDISHGNGRQTILGKNGIINAGVQCYGKRRNASIEKSKFPVFEYSLFKLSSINYKKKLRDYYKTLTQKPDPSDTYIVYFLHYQPEATSNPSGDIFVDQRLCIELLLKNLPSSYKIYVKEHPHQFMSHREGHTSRMREFYDDLKKNKRVKLLDIDEDTFMLIKNAKAVSTIVGTVGWEAIVYEKPLILFGISWYENYEGVLRIKDELSAQKIFDFIEKYKYDEHNLLSYLAAVGKNTHRAYYYKAGNKSVLNLSEDECVNNIVNSILSKLNETD